MLAHIHIQKTGGQTVCDILRQSFPGTHCDLRSRLATSADLRLARCFYPRMASIAGYGVLPLSDLGAWESVRFFAFIRDPLKRCASHYQFAWRKHGLRTDFETWIRTNADHQTRYLTRTGPAVGTGKVAAEQAIAVLQKHVGLVGLLERFNESLVLLRRWSGNPGLNVCYRSRNVARDNDVKNRVLEDPRSRELLRRYNAEDEKLYRYVCEVVYPRQVAEYGGSLAGDVAELEASLPAPARFSIGRTLASAKRNLLYKPVARCLTRRAA